MGNIRRVEKTVTKRFLHHCVDLPEKSDIFRGISLNKIKEQKEDRDKFSSLRLRTEGLKVKVKLIIDGHPKYFA